MPMTTYGKSFTCVICLFQYLVRFLSLYWITVGLIMHSPIEGLFRPTSIKTTQFRSPASKLAGIRVNCKKKKFGKKQEKKKKKKEYREKELKRNKKIHSKTISVCSKYSKFQTVFHGKNIHLQLRTKFMKQCQEIKQNWPGRRRRKTGY